MANYVDKTVTYTNRAGSEVTEKQSVNGYATGVHIGTPVQDYYGSDMENSLYYVENSTVRQGSVTQGYGESYTPTLRLVNACTPARGTPNFGEYTISNFRKSSATGIDYEVDLTVTGTIASVNYTEPSGTYEGKWAGVILDFGIPITQITYVTRELADYPFTIADVKNAENNGAYNKNCIDIWSKTDSDFITNVRDLTFKLTADETKQCVVRVNLES